MASITSYADRALNALPGGCNGEFNLPERLTTVVDRGKGCLLWASDGREMLDFSMGWGSVLIGHSDPRITEPVAMRLSRGTNFATITEPSVRLAEELIDISPAAELVRFLRLWN